MSGIGQFKGDGIRRTLALMALSLTLAVLAAACSKEAADAGSSGSDAAAVPGGVNRRGSLLAYEHEVSIRLPASKIAGSLAAAREACMSERFGICSVLTEELGAGESPSGSLKVRADPKVVPPLVKLAAEGGEIAQRSTRAEDLADAVRDNGLRQKRLQMQHQKLTEILARPDIKVEEMIPLTERLSELETGLQEAEQEEAQQRRRIETNLLTLNFHSTGITAESSEIRQSIRGLGKVWDSSTAALITLVGALLPFAAFLGLIWLTARAVRRRNRTTRPAE